MPLPTFHIQRQSDGAFEPVSPMEALLFVLELGDDAEISNPTADNRVFIRRNPRQPHFVLAWGNRRGLVQTEILDSKDEALERHERNREDFDACILAETRDHADALFISRVLFCLSAEEIYNAEADSILDLFDLGRDRAEALRAETN